MLSLMAWSFGAHATLKLPRNEKIWDTRAHAWMTLEEWGQREILPGDVLVLGEQHAVGKSLSERVHHSNQQRLMLELARRHPVSLGMEFFPYPKQSLVDQYVKGRLPEAKFLKIIGWGRNAFPLYREQVKFPKAHGGRTIALNIPRSISGKVGNMGPDSLDATERSLLPPLWERGGPQYFERFAETMRGHVSEAMIENFFWAQSLWDDTMAWKVAENHPAGSDQVLVVIAGEFHVDFGHALPARLSRHGVPSVKTMVQAEVADWTEKSLAQAIAEDPRYGARADHIWVYQP